MTEKQWIDLIKGDAIKAAQMYGYIPSVLIAQTCQETGYGETDLSKSGIYNTVGMKTELLNATWTSKYWSGATYVKKTPEWYDGKKTYITDSFRVYRSYFDGLADYCQFMHDAKYSVGGEYKYRGLLGKKDPYTLIEGVRSRGYCTDPSYSKAIMSIIEKHNLTQYDGISGGVKVDVNINKTYYPTEHNSYSVNDPKYIIIHNTDNYSSGADAKAHAKGLYNGDMVNMSWHYVIDDKSIYACLPYNRGAMHVGKNFGSNNLFGTVNNRNSICIEICVNPECDYEKAFSNAVQLTRYVMNELGITEDRVLQHYDVCSKNCPSEIRKRGDWQRFKEAIKSDIDVNKSKEGRYMFAFGEVKYNEKGEFRVDDYVLQTILRGRGINGKDGKPLKLDGKAQTNTMYAVDVYIDLRSKQGADLGDKGCWGVKCWSDVFGRKAI